MSSAEDRMIEVALAEVLGGRAPPDLTGRILDEARLRRTRRVRRRRWAAVAAAAVAVGIGLVLRSRERTTLPVRLTLDREVSVEGPGGQRRRDVALTAGDRLVVRDATARIALPGGGALFAAPGSVIAIEGPSGRPLPTLRDGSATVASGDREERIATPLGEIGLAPNARADVDLPLPPGVDAVSRARRTERALAGTAAPPSLLVGCTRGSGRLVSAGGSAPIAAGRLAVAAPGEAPRVGPYPTADLRRALDALLADAGLATDDTDPRTADGRDRLKRAGDALSKIARRVASDPSARLYLVGRLQALPDGERQTDLRRELAGILARDPELLARGLLEQLVTREPALLAAGDLLRLAEGGLGAAEAALEARLRAEGDRGDVTAALFLAVRGSDAGRAVLGAHAAFGEVFPYFPDRVLEGAAGLSALGDDGPWRAAVRRVREEAMARAEAGDLDRARWLATRAGYFAPLARGNATPLADLSARVAAYQRERLDGLRDRDDVQRVFDDLLR